MEKPSRPGQHDVEQDQVRLDAADQFQRLVGVGCGEDLVALRLERLGEHADVDRVVVDDEDFLRVHGGLSTGAVPAWTGICATMRWMVSMS